MGNNAYKNDVKYMIDKFDEIPEYKITEVRELLTSIQESVKLALKENPDLSFETVSTEIQNLMNTYLDNSDKTDYKTIKLSPSSFQHPTRSDLYLYKTLETIIKRPGIISELISKYDMKKIIDNTQTTFKYTPNISNNYEMFLKDVFVIFKQKLPPETIQKIYNNELSHAEIMSLQKQILDFVKYFNEKLYNKIIKNGTINKVINFTQILDFTNILPRNNNNNNIRLQSMNMNFLGFNYFYNNDDEISRPYVSSLLEPSLYSNYKIEELFGMCAFYANRTAKAINVYNNGLYVLHKTGLLKKFYEDPDYKFNLSDEEIRNLLIQQSLLEKTCKDFIKNKQSEDDDDLYHVTDSTIYEELNNPIIKQAIRKYDNFYPDEFSKLLPNYQHDLLKDLTEGIKLAATTSYAYDIKYNAIESLIFMLMEKGKELNWGIVLESIRDKDTDNIIIGIDLKEFNMPIKLHCPKNKILDFIRDYTGSSIIPVYEGNNDMIMPTKNGDKFYSTQILLKLSKDQRKLLKETADTINPNDYFYKFVKHLAWMSLPKRVPDFLLNENGTFVKRFYDFDKNKVYTEKYLEELQNR